MKRDKKFSGVVVPMITPFLGPGCIDEQAVKRIVEHLLAAGVQGIFVLGTTGEAASILQEERMKLVKVAKEAVKGRAVLYAGVSGNCLQESITASHVYKASGADVVVSHPPFYYMPSEMDLENYFCCLADAIELPLILYNIPKTTHVNIPLELVDRLCVHPNIIGIKDSSSEAQRMVELLKRVGGREDWVVLGGCASLLSLALRHGADGMVPSSGNLWPEIYQKMWLAAKAGDWNQVDIQQKYSDEVGAQYQKGRSLGESLAALKVLMEAKGLCGRMVLPPLRSIPEKEGVPCNVLF